MKMKTFGFQGVQMMDELNKEAILEGLLYVVGEEGIKEESISSIMEISIEDTRALLKNIENKCDDKASDNISNKMISTNNPKCSHAGCKKKSHGTDNRPQMEH